MDPLEEYSSTIARVGEATATVIRAGQRFQEAATAFLESAATYVELIFLKTMSPRATIPEIIASSLRRVLERNVELLVGIPAMRKHLHEDYHFLLDDVLSGCLVVIGMTLMIDVDGKGGKTFAASVGKHAPGTISQLAGAAVNVFRAYDPTQSIHSDSVMLGCRGITALASAIVVVTLHVNRLGVDCESEQLFTPSELATLIEMVALEIPQLTSPRQEEERHEARVQKRNSQSWWRSCVLHLVPGAVEQLRIWNSGVELAPLASSVATHVHNSSESLSRLSAKETATVVLQCQWALALSHSLAYERDGIAAVDATHILRKSVQGVPLSQQQLDLVAAVYHKLTRNELGESSCEAMHAALNKSNGLVGIATEWSRLGKPSTAVLQELASDQLESWQRQIEEHQAIGNEWEHSLIRHFRSAVGREQQTESTEALYESLVTVCRELQSSRLKIRELHTKLEENMENEHSLKNQISSMHAQLRDTRDTLQRVETLRSTLQQEFDLHKEHAAQQIEELTKKCKTRANTITELKQKLTRLQSAHAQIKSIASSEDGGSLF